MGHVHATGGGEEQNRSPCAATAVLSDLQGIRCLIGGGQGDECVRNNVPLGLGWGVSRRHKVIPTAHPGAKIAGRRAAEIGQFGDGLQITIATQEFERIFEPDRLPATERDIGRGDDHAHALAIARNIDRSIAAIGTQGTVMGGTHGSIVVPRRAAVAATADRDIERVAAKGHFVKAIAAVGIVEVERLLQLTIRGNRVLRAIPKAQKPVLQHQVLAGPCRAFFPSECCAIGDQNFDTTGHVVGTAGSVGSALPVDEGQAGAAGCSQVGIDLDTALRRQGQLVGRPADGIVDEDIAHTSRRALRRGGDGDIATGQVAAELSAGDLAAAGGNGVVVRVDQPGTAWPLGAQGRDHPSGVEANIGCTGLDETT